MDICRLSGGFINKDDDGGFEGPAPLSVGLVKAFYSAYQLTPVRPRNTYTFTENIVQFDILRSSKERNCFILCWGFSGLDFFLLVLHNSYILMKLKLQIIGPQVRGTWHCYCMIRTIPCRWLPHLRLYGSGTTKPGAYAVFFVWLHTWPPLYCFTSFATPHVLGVHDTSDVYLQHRSC